MANNQENQKDLKDSEARTAASKEEQRQYADNASQKYDECDRFDLDSLKGNVHNDRKGEADDDK